MLSVRKLVFAGALLVVVPFAAYADEPKAAPKTMPPATTTAPAAPAVLAPGACPPATTKVCQLVPTMVEETRTVMKPVQKTETYTAYKSETVQEKKIVPVTTYKTETYTEMVTKTHCVKVPVTETKVVMEKRKKIEWVTEYKEKCKLRFEKDCKTIGGCGDKCGSCCGDKCGGDGCNKGFSFSFPVYKPKLEKECVPCTVPKCTYECVPVTKTCTTYKKETRTECVPVCKTRCVPCTENKEVICCKQVCVPYQATRCVTVCEPVCEKVQVCKMVPTWVDVPCAPAAPACAPAAPACNEPCNNNAGNNACHGDDNCGKGGCFSICDKFSGCKDKLKECCNSFGDKFSGCCSKIKGCFCCN
jgi:hypothetical protein